MAISWDAPMLLNSISAATISAQPAWQRSLRVRLTLWYIGILGVLLLLGAFLLYVAAHRALLTETDAYLQQEARHIALACGESTSGSPDPAEIRESLASATGPGTTQGKNSAFLSFDTSYARIVKYVNGTTNQFEVVAQSPTIAADPSISQALDVLLYQRGKQLISRQFAGSTDESRLRAAAISIHLGNEPAIIQVAVPWDHNADILEHLGAGLVICLMLVLLVAGAGGWILVAKTLHPIARIVEEADRLDAADLPTALIPDAFETDTEVGRLVVTLNRMMTRLRSAFDAQRRFAEAQQRFAADASHELRTPLTILRGEMDVALTRPRDAETYRAVIASAVEEIDRMSRIVEGLSLSAEYDAENLAPGRRAERIDLRSITQVAVDELCAKATAKGIAIKLRGDGATEPEAAVMGDPEQFRLLLRNLIDNAVKYTNPEGLVEVTISGHPNQDSALGGIVVTIKDNGIGIAPDDIPFIFDRFWRADRTQNREGSGLGLAISRQIAMASGGTLVCSSRLGEGAEFTLWLPRAA